MMLGKEFLSYIMSFYLFKTLNLQFLLLANYINYYLIITSYMHLHEKLRFANSIVLLKSFFQNKSSYIIILIV